MKNESSISLGGTILLLALFAQKYMFAQIYILSRSSNTVSHFIKALKYKKEIFSHSQGIILSALKWKKEPFQFYTPVYKKDTKENQNKSMETTNSSKPKIEIKKTLKW